MIKRFVKFAKANPVMAAVMTICLAGFFVYGSTKPPPAVVEKGIAMTECIVDAKGLSLKWKSEDERIVPGETTFIIEVRERDTRIGPYIVNKGYDPSWKEIGRTKNFNFFKPGVWTDKTREIRIRTVIE